MNEIHTIDFGENMGTGALCVTNDLLYVAVGMKDAAQVLPSYLPVCSYDVETFEPVGRSTAHESITSMVGAAGLLFCALQSGDVVVYDARTLAERRRFGAALLVLLTGPETEYMDYVTLEIVGDELFVATEFPGRVHVFSFAGEHLRDVSGDWRTVADMVHHDGRLYVIECRGEAEFVYNENEPDADNDDESTWSEAKKQAGKRIFVLTPQGETLQVGCPPVEQLGFYLEGLL